MMSEKRQGPQSVRRNHTGNLINGAIMHGPTISLDGDLHVVASRPARDVKEQRRLPIGLVDGPSKQGIVSAMLLLLLLLWLRRGRRRRDGARLETSHGGGPLGFAHNSRLVFFF